MKNCTWKDCKSVACVPQLDKNKKEWANLCQKHHDEIEDSFKNFSPKKILKSWILAQGGAKVAAKKTMGG